MLLFLVVHATICNFFLPEGCHGNLPVLNLLSAPVAKNQHFRPCKKKICVGSKNDWHFYNCYDVLCQHAKFGGDRTTRAGCIGAKIGVFCMSCLVCLRVAYIVQTSIVTVYGSILMRFQRFFQKDLFFQMHYIVLIFDARCRYNFREIKVKNCEKSKNRRKCLCAPLHIDSWEIWRKFHCNSLAMYLDVHLHKNVFHVTLYSADSNCQISYR